MADEQLHSFDTGVSGWTTVVSKYGNGKGTREQFQKSTPEKLDPITGILDDASRFASDTVHTQLGEIITAMKDAWRGDNADQAVEVLTSLQTDAHSVSTNVHTVSSYLKAFRSDWADIRSRALNLGDDDDATARSLFDEFIAAENHAKDHWPNTLYYHEPLQGDQDKFTPDPGGQPGGGPGGGPGGYPGGHPGPGGPGGQPGGPGGGPGGPGGPGNYPGNYPGGGGPGGYPGNYPGGGGPGGYPGGHPGGYPGAHVDTGSHLAGLDGGAGGGPGGGIGGGPGGIGGAPGGPGGAPGAGPGGGPGGVGLVAGGGPGAGGAAGPGRGMMPGHGGGGDDEERDRSTWLTEDDDIWNGDDAPPGVIG